MRAFFLLLTFITLVFGAVTLFAGVTAAMEFVVMPLLIVLMAIWVCGMAAVKRR